MYSKSITKSQEIINFFKDKQKSYEKDLINLIDSANSGLYIIDDTTLSFTENAKKIFNLSEDISVETFYNNINLQDRKNLITILNKSQKQNSTYEVIYRYKFNNDSMIWIKEHGVFNYSNNKQRLALVTNFTKQVDQDKQLHKLAFYDNVTGFKNRNYFEQDANFLIKYNIPFTLFLIDINSFKIINDNFGHFLGDNVLKLFAENLKNCLAYDFDFEIYRFVSDDFVIVFPYVKTKKDALKIIEKIINKFNKQMLIDDYKINITPSIGITFFPKDACDLQTLLKYANICIAKVKSEAYLKYCFFEYEYYEKLLEEETIEGHIKQLIIDKQITLNYQPIFDIVENKIIAFEALFENNNAFNNGQIFDIALKSDLIVDLDKYIIEKVIKDVSTNLLMIPKNIRFSINLSPKTVKYIDIYEIFKTMFEKYQVSGEMFSVEITEQYFLDDEQYFNDIILKLQSIGVKVYLDDFGMGFSSIRNLAYITYDCIKVDKRIMSSLFNNYRCNLLVKSIYNFTQIINCDIIFEGIENEKQVEFLTSIGGRYIQGYYISKPIDIKQAINLIVIK